MEDISEYSEIEQKHTESKVRRKRKRNKRLRQNMPLLFMFIPVIIFYIVFKYLPMFGVVIAFKDYTFADGVFGSEWVGWENFERIFSYSQTRNVIRNTFVLSVLSIIITFPVPIILAILINELRKMWFKRTVQTLVYLPHFFSWVIVGGMIVTMFSQESGIINDWIKAIFGKPYPFLYEEGSWISIYIGSAIWKEAGFSAILYLATLMSIDPTLYEAAKIDGANKWKQIKHITIPGIMPMVILMLILSMGRVMEIGFEHVFVLQNDVVRNVSEVISTYIYKVGLQGGEFSLTAAMGLFESFIGLILVLIANQVARKFGRGLW